MKILKGWFKGTKRLLSEEFIVEEYKGGKHILFCGLEALGQ
jgi:hypothetical protein